jgi:hypothetical protein
VKIVSNIVVPPYLLLYQKTHQAQHEGDHPPNTDRESQQRPQSSSIFSADPMP